jgi:hypothetical protein
MGEAFESIMRGLGEVRAHREGKLKLKTTEIEIAPLPSMMRMRSKLSGTLLGFLKWSLPKSLVSPRRPSKPGRHGRNVTNGAACRFLEVLRRIEASSSVKQIVTYAARPPVFAPWRGTKAPRLEYRQRRILRPRNPKREWFVRHPVGSWRS